MNNIIKQDWEMSISYDYILVFDLDGILRKCKRVSYISYILYLGLRALHLGLHLTNMPTDELKN